MLQVLRLEKIGDKHEFIEYIKKTSKNLNLTIQAVDPHLILSKRQVKFAVEHALSLFKSKKNRAKTLENEILMVLAATRNFDQAVQNFGVKTNEATVIISGNKPKAFINKLGKKIHTVFKPNKEKILKVYMVSEKSLNKFQLEDMVLEKMALAANEK